VLSLAKKGNIQWSRHEDEEHVLFRIPVDEIGCAGPRVDPNRGLPRQRPRTRRSRIQTSPETELAPHISSRAPQAQPRRSRDRDQAPQVAHDQKVDQAAATAQRAGGCISFSAGVDAFRSAARPAPALSVGTCRPPLGSVLADSPRIRAGTRQLRSVTHPDDPRRPRPAYRRVSDDIPRKTAVIITARPVRTRLRIAAVFTAIAVAIAGALTVVFAPFTATSGRAGVITAALAAAPQTVIVQCEQFRGGGYPRDELPAVEHRPAGHVAAPGPAVDLPPGPRPTCAHRPKTSADPGPPAGRDPTRLTCPFPAPT
jgi:hypothetical protein